jgi:hypothetical protein
VCGWEGFFRDAAEGKNKNMKNLEQLKHHLNEKKVA